VFALVSPPITAVLVWLTRLFELGGMLRYTLNEAFVLLFFLSPVLGLLTLAILLVQYSLFGEELEPMRMSRRLVAVLAGLAIVSPVWLPVIGLLFTDMSR
jgi:hypothetical protein